VSDARSRDKVEIGVTELEPRTGKYGSVSEGGERTQDSWKLTEEGEVGG
jgi:hypothetical protein